ncbi:MAG: hypothetical protein SFX18_09130 [Pirellulales bacterium]|nr:hypothetical protein [Pirellulales bacterium]
MSSQLCQFRRSGLLLILLGISAILNFERLVSAQVSSAPSSADGVAAARAKFQEKQAELEAAAREAAAAAKELAEQAQKEAAAAAEDAVAAAQEAAREAAEAAREVLNDAASEAEKAARQAEAAAREKAREALDAAKAALDPDAKTAKNEEKNHALQAQREANFAKLMSGATLEGSFTSRDQPGQAPQADKYTLGKVSHVKGDLWRFETRIQYGKTDVTVPLTLRVVWAEDTPIISLDKMLIPGVGTFTSRVMIFNNSYAGMWDGGGDHGGLMFGKIVAAQPAEAVPAEAPAATKEPGK